MARHPWRMAHDSWYDPNESFWNRQYEKALDDIPKEHYTEYDSLVHVGWNLAVDRLTQRLQGKSNEHYEEILRNYEDNLHKAAEIPGASDAAHWARIWGLETLFAAVGAIDDAEENLKRARELLRRG